METSRHHLWWQRASYKTPLERRFRNCGAFVVPLLVPVHKELHANIPPPPKPSASMMLTTLTLVESLDEDVIDTALAVSDLFAERDTRIDTKISEHLRKQVGYLIEGYLPCEEAA